jgi:hypothetical protein
LPPFEEAPGFYMILFAPVASTSFVICFMVSNFSSDVFSSKVFAGFSVLLILVRSIGILYGSSAAPAPTGACPKIVPPALAPAPMPPKPPNLEA